jgi:CRISPR-associated protein Cas6/Cse3/CasE subtype I-E
MSLIASVLHLDRKAVQALKIKDIYGLHKAVYSLFPDVRSAEEKQSSTPSGFIYADQGGDYKSRKILLLSDRPPMAQIRGEYGEVQSRPISAEFLQYDTYRFKVTVNPTRRDSASRKLVPVKGREAIAQWFTSAPNKAGASRWFRPSCRSIALTFCSSRIKPSAVLPWRRRKFKACSRLQIAQTLFRALAKALAVVAPSVVAYCK